MGLFKQTFPSRRRAVSPRAVFSLFAAAAGALLLATAPLRSSAAQLDERNTVSLADDPPALAVRYGALNLATEVGARALLERIQLAADTVCPAVDNRDLGKLRARHRCVRVAVERAVQQVGNARLAAVYSGSVQHG